MRRIFLATLCVWTVLLAAVSIGRVQYNVVNSSGTLPTCTGNGGLYVKTGASEGFYWCLGGEWEGPAGSSVATSGRHRFGWTWTGAALVTGTHPLPVSIPVTGTIVRIRLAADVSCDAQVDIWKETYANFSATQPDNSDAIPGTNEPELTSDQKFEDTTFTGYSTTTLTEGDVLKANVDSFSGCTVLWLQVDYEE